MIIRQHYDAVVVGGGIAGLSAALTAAEAGLDVALVEKQADVGGSTVMSGGFFAFSGTSEQAKRGIEDSAELFRADLIAVAGGVADTSLIDAYLTNQAATHAWLRAHDAVFDEIELSSGQSAPRSHHTDIRALVRGLATRFIAAGGNLLTGLRAETLLTDSHDRVTGVAVRRASGQLQELAASGVVIASGGFSRGTDLLATFAPEQLKAIPYGGLGNAGDGLKMAWRLGAGVADMGYISGTYGSHPHTGPEFHELLTAYYLGAIVVNISGRRFVDESQSYKVLGRECLKQPHGIGFQIFDRKVRAKSRAGLPLSDMDLLQSIGHLHEAADLDALAALAGIDATALRATVERYNSAARGEQPDEFERASLVNGVGEILTIDKGPYYAYPAMSMMTSTYCGITITPQAEVKRVDGTVISGLYAVGEVTGGFHGAAYMTGTSLGKGAVFGRIAAERLVGEISTA